ncbi:MaoC family dehydratase [Thalassorhabdomicrobium marinisediminis]|uniref:Dehydratase n=1 Tax=Thalassorhabdomicrobium marinisediminis TaxID=2170577 RepID=A0A2T7FU96_9RHOB|nr:MaoC family dehydratase [Thalassorhabdomicrobium marinisediminis]PVA05733.1 dehydratase [Thalassorhabdomicrobium marinisediminis]
MTFRFSSADEVVAAIGTQLGPTDWLTIEQDRIDMFAEATGDHQWLHVDPERAAKGPFGRTIAHGFLTLSLVNMALPELFMPDNLDWGVNYGVDKVRFPAPVPVGSRIRTVGEIVEAKDLGQRTIQTKVRLTVKIEEGAKPACVADTLQRYAFLP